MLFQCSASRPVGGLKMAYEMKDIRMSQEVFARLLEKHQLGGEDLGSFSMRTQPARKFRT